MKIKKVNEMNNLSKRYLIIDGNLEYGGVRALYFNDFEKLCEENDFEKDDENGIYYFEAITIIDLKLNKILEPILEKSEGKIKFIGWDFSNDEDWIDIKSAY